MNSSILFITRTWHGNGGLQRFSRDLWRGISSEFGDRASVCRPSGPGVFALMFFGVRGFCAGIRAGLKGVHIHLGDASLAPLGAIVSFLTGARVSVTVAGLDIIYPALWYQLLLRHSLKRMHRICCISHATAERVCERGIGEEKIVIIPCGVWMSDVVRSANLSIGEVQVLLSICRLVPRKGVVWFVECVFPLLLEKNPLLHYRIIGDGPERVNIETIIAEKKLGKNVSVLGAVDDDVREQELRNANLFIVPNIAVAQDMEGFGIVCIEASGRGIPVVASRLEGLQEAVIDGETGYFFKPGNVYDAVSVIQSMLATKMDAAGVSRATTHQFDWPGLIIRYRHEVFR